MRISTQMDDMGKLILRLGVGGMMLFHGIAKIVNLQSLEFIKSRLESVDLHPLLAYGVYLGEIVAPLLIILGIYSRFGGFLIFVNMLFAILLVHANELLQLTKHGGWQLELQAFYLIGGILILLMGSGRYAFKPD